MHRAAPVLLVVAGLMAGCGPSAETQPAPTTSASPNSNDLAVVRLIEGAGSRLNRSVAQLLPAGEPLGKVRAVADERRLLAAEVFRGADTRLFELAVLLRGGATVQEAGAAATRAFLELRECARIASAYYSGVTAGTLNRRIWKAAGSACRSARAAYRVARNEAAAVPDE